MQNSRSHPHRCLALFLFVLAFLSATAQRIENVRSSFDQSKQLMVIYYDLKGLNYKKEIKITPYIASGDTALQKMRSLAGDFGWIARSGKNKMVTWDPFQDGVSSLEGIQVGIRPGIELRDAIIPRFKGLLLHGSNSAPLGLKFVQLAPVGFFAGIRMGKLPPGYTYTVTNDGAMDYNESGVYEIGTQKRLAGYAITAGPVFQIARSMYVYAGAGYGVEQLFWQYKAFNLDKSPLGSEWALNENIDRKGLVMDGGIVVRLGRMLLDLGISTVQFESLQVTGGVGWAFFNGKKG